MMEYHAAYYEGDDALRVTAQTNIEMREPLPTPNPTAWDSKAILMEAICS